MTRNLKSTTTPAISAVDFRTFIQRADLEDIDKFLELASTTHDGRNLALLWERAYDRGYGEGREDVLGEELELGTQALEHKWMLRGRAVGYEEGYKKGKEDFDVKNACSIAFEEGRRIGEANERSLWEKGGHHLTKKCTNSPPTCNVGVQSEMLPLISLSTQTSPPSLVNVNIQTSATMVSSLDWAEDATSLPALPLPPRDLSGLRSSKLNPFSSLQRRSKNRIGRTYRSRRCSLFNSFHPPHQISFSPFQQHSPKTYSHLNWESDPRLSDLSRSLKALGWIRAC